MKKTALFLLLPILLLSNNIQACPVWYVGKIKIVDQYFNEIDSAKICKYFNSGDSFYLPKTYGTI